MAAQTTKARRSRAGNSIVSCTLAAEGRAATGMPSLATTRWYLVPRLALSVGFGPINSPPRLARTLQLSMTTSHAAAAASGPERTMRTSAACTRRSRDPLFVFNQFGDVERCALRSGNVHSADGWRAVLEPV